MKIRFDNEVTSDGTSYSWHGPDASNAVPVVLVHGLGLRQQMWQWQLPALSQNYQVLTYDLYGHGESVVAPETPSLTVFAEQLARLLDSNGIDKCCVVGFSLGGMIARRFAMDFSERLSAVAILHSPHARTAEDQMAIERRVHQVAEGGPASTVEAALARWFTDTYRNENPQMMDLIRQWVMANDPAIYPSNYQVLATGVKELIAPECPISCPALVMTGEDDFGQPAHMAHAIAAEMPNSQTVVLPKLRHMAMAEEPNGYNQTLLTFFDRVL